MERESATNGVIEALGVLDPKRLIDTCQEWGRWKFRGLVLNLALMGFGKVRVICGSRTYEQQARLFGRGRSRAAVAGYGVPGEYAEPGMACVSWIDPRFSAHVRGRAIDLDWSEYGDVEWEGVEVLCRQLGVTWGGVWSVRDYSHFEV